VGYRLAADLVAVLHLAAILFAVSGALLAWRWPRLLWAHVTLFALIAAINLTGSDCPVTTLEKHLRHLGGERPYTDGFIAHYLVGPLHPAGITPTVNVVIYTVIVLPTVVGYLGLAVRHHRRPPASRCAHARAESRAD
jgi:hypothetical protein